MSERFGLSSLTLSLLLLAALALLAVVGYNAWVSRRRGSARRDIGAEPAARNLSSVGESRVVRAEPSLSATPGAVAPATDAASADASGDPTSAEPQSTDASAPARTDGATASLEVAAAPRLHPLTDCIIEFQLDEPVPSERVLPLANGFRRVGSKPVVVEGCPPMDESGEPAWSGLAPRQRLARVRVGVLLANRHGPLNAMEYSEFVNGVQKLAEQLDLLGDTPDMNAVLQRARALDESCAALDAQIGLNVEAPDALGLTELARLAHETQCVERGNNRYARLSTHGEVIFSLSLADTPTRLSLLLDVPRAPLSAQPWAAMVACARHCAQRLEGRLVDDQGRPLPDVTLERLESQLDERQRALCAAGLEPGSVVALRVFN